MGVFLCKLLAVTKEKRIAKEPENGKSLHQLWVGLSWKMNLTHGTPGRFGHSTLSASQTSASAR
jgi:hypothetical protein